jgi:GNAT superfamily N-acetyltransferase
LREQGFRHSPPDFYCLVAEENGKLVGFLVYYFVPFTYRAKPNLIIKELYVAEGFRSKRIGELLMKAVAKEAPWRGGRRGLARISTLRKSVPGSGCFVTLTRVIPSKVEESRHFIVRNTAGCFDSARTRPLFFRIQPLHVISHTVFEPKLRFVTQRVARVREIGLGEILIMRMRIIDVIGLKICAQAFI